MGYAKEKGKGSRNGTGIRDNELGGNAGKGQGTSKGEGMEAGYEWVSEILRSERSMALGGMLGSSRRVLTTAYAKGKMKGKMVKGKGDHEIG